MAKKYELRFNSGTTLPHTLHGFRLSEQKMSDTATVVVTESTSAIES